MTEYLYTPKENKKWYGMVSVVCTGSKYTVCQIRAYQDIDTIEEALDLIVRASGFTGAYKAVSYKKYQGVRK